MHQFRKCSRRNLILLLSVVGGYLLVDYALNNRDYVDNREKISLIEESIRSLANQGACKLPNLPVDSPEMISFLKDEPPVECGDENDDWVSCHKSLCTIKPEVVKARGKITCDIADIIRTDDYKIQYDTPVRTTTSYTLKKSDFARAKCWTESRYRWTGIIVGIREDPELLARHSWNKENSLNVLIIGFDSLSRNAFIRKLPKAYKYLTKYLKADVLQGYNIVGDGTPQALIPLLHTRRRRPKGDKATRRKSIKQEGAEVIDNGVVEGAADLHALQNHNLLIALRDAARATPPNFPMSPAFQHYLRVTQNFDPNGAGGGGGAGGVIVGGDVDAGDDSGPENDIDSCNLPLNLVATQLGGSDNSQH